VRQLRQIIDHRCGMRMGRLGSVILVFATLGAAQAANAANSMSAQYAQYAQYARHADALKPAFRDGFGSTGFHDFYRGMANASNWFAIDSVEMLLGLGSALVALLALLFLSAERRKEVASLVPVARATVEVSGPKDPVEQRQLRRAEARRRRNVRAAAETSSRLGP